MPVIARPQTEHVVQPRRPWQVILFNEDRHTFDEVILQVQKATGCNLEEATRITWTAHTDGQAVCFSGPLERCEIVAAKLQEIRLNVSIERAP
ncbi:MAG: ATP-dependent Clp protease adaptor ClpS [Planctomycetes bacterium]|nr:ATP-dependent Clp protease adaptor ClpS [Planctomycetota bacterium]